MLDLTDEHSWLDNYVMIDNGVTYTVAPELDYEESDLEFIHIPGRDIQLKLSQIEVDFSCNTNESELYQWSMKGAVHQLEAMSDNLVILRQRDLSSLFASFQIDCVAPFDEEYRLSIEMNAIKMNLDQELLDFVLKFTEKEESTPSKIYFQFVDISSVEIELDFKPKIVASNVTCANILNSIQVKGVKLQLPAIEDGGFLGFGRLFDHIASSWVPSLIKDQRMNLLLGFGPVKSVANLGKGVSDFLVLPLKEYHSNGRILSGIQAGTVSLAKRTGHEALNLCSTIASASETLLDGTLNAIQTSKSKVTKKVLGDQSERAFAIIQPLIKASKRIEILCHNLQDFLDDCHLEG